ncbi:tumor protein D54 [Leptonychotes weddellii]|uniref:Tumor protein D54 n=1 Tax=Leptonychotes weddellii TaxID=9713 RepID=A0A7F8RQ85_LEPWE|nr:tumor protein D54 [Leptonychotes weddellii]
MKTSEKLGEWNEKVTQSDLYKKTQETLSQAGQKTSAALSTMGSAISRKLGDMRWDAIAAALWDTCFGPLSRAVVSPVTDSSRPRWLERHGASRVSGCARSFLGMLGWEQHLREAATVCGA